MRHLLPQSSSFTFLCSALLYFVYYWYCDLDFSYQMGQVSTDNHTRLIRIKYTLFMSLFLLAEKFNNLPRTRSFRIELTYKACSCMNLLYISMLHLKDLCWMSSYNKNFILKEKLFLCWHVASFQILSQEITGSPPLFYILSVVL